MSYSLKSVFAPLPWTERGMPLVLHGDPKGKNFLYTAGRSVVIRDIENPGIAEMYTEHSVDASVACYAPSGYYIASGDSSGKIRIWDTTQKEHLLKYEYQPISGKIKDIAWSADSKRIAICGEGREKFGHVFLWDSGSSVGEITGHSKFINSIDYRPVRPFRVITGGEDKNIGWFEGPPFRFKTSLREHTRFVNAVRFSPDGELACSGGADGKAVLIDGKTGEVKSSLGEKQAHAGGIYALSWGPDSKQVLTASGDRTCKLWDVTTGQMVCDFIMGSAIEDQQVSCLWQGENLLSVSLSGFINYLDVNNPRQPRRVLKGQKTNLTSLYHSTGSLYAGSLSGRIKWGLEEGQVDLVSGPGHTNLVCSMQATADRLYSLGMDKALKTVEIATNEFSGVGLSLTGLDPTGMALTADETVVVATTSELVLARGGERVGELKVNYHPQCAAAHPTLQEVVIGGKDSTLHVYTINGDSLIEKTVFQVSNEVVVVRYSPDGNSVAVSSGRHVMVYNTSNYQSSKDLLFHTAKVMCLSWSPDSARIASGGIDTNVILWNVASGNRESVNYGAHRSSVVSGVAWISDTSFASCGYDGCIRVWEHKA